MCFILAEEPESSMSEERPEVELFVKVSSPQAVCFISFTQADNFTLMGINAVIGSNMIQSRGYNEQIYK